MSNSKRLEELNHLKNELKEFMNSNADLLTEDQINILLDKLSLINEIIETLEMNDLFN